VERLLVARAAATYVQVAYYDARQAQSRALTPAQARQFVLQQGAAQQRHLQALRALTMHQKFLAPPRPAKAAREPVLPDTPRFSGGQHDTDPLVHGIGVLNCRVNGATCLNHWPGRSDLSRPSRSALRRWKAGQAAEEQGRRSGARLAP
jgi:hypothetical protein